MKLGVLGFEPGDPLDRILSVEYEKVGFKYCEWVLRAESWDWTGCPEYG